MKKINIIPLLLFLLCSINGNATEAEYFWKSKTPWQKMIAVLYAHGVDTTGMGVTSQVRANILNQAAPDLAKTFGIKHDLVQPYSDWAKIGDVLCQYMQLKYTRQSEKHMYYRTRYSTDEDDYAEFILTYPDSRYAGEMQWKRNCMHAFWSWPQAVDAEDCQLAYYRSKIVDNNVYEGLAPVYRDIVQYIQTVEDWEQLMQSRAANGYSDCDAFTQFKRDHNGRIPGYNFVIADSVRNCKHNNAWREACATNTISSYREYFTLFPQGEHAAWARNYVADHEDWLEAREKDSHTAYATYCEKHPQGDSVAVAKECMRRIEESLWQRVKDSKNWLDLQAFLDRFPEGYYSEQATSAIKALFVSPETDMNKVFEVFGACSLTDTGVVCVSNTSKLESSLRFTITHRGRTVLQKTLRSGESYQLKLRAGSYHVVIDNPSNILYGMSDPYATHGDMNVSPRIYFFSYFSYPRNSVNATLSIEQIGKIYSDGNAWDKSVQSMYSFLERNGIVVWLDEYLCFKDNLTILYRDGYNTNSHIKDNYLTGETLKQTKARFTNELLDIYLELVFAGITPLRVVEFNPLTSENDVFEYNTNELRTLKNRKKTKK